MKAILIALIALSFSPVSFATTKEEVQQKTSEAASAAASYTKEQKEQFEKDMQAKYDSLKTEIAEMKAEAAKETGEAKKAMNEQIAILEKKQAEMKKDMAKLSKSSGAAWAEMKTGVSNAWNSLSASYEKAKAHFNEDNK
ncbi:hypothetical protein [Bdellovibrio sp. NC01]|uniref:hypothetical protein n=1 Tax=Bdellovibrio sp. NC01 TaxID=2220073 RepID=UPI001159F7D0|nr:hypothetical protein [Bdellovibrio sp. NC01]QDK39189.1 hypothetical protein DOE51_17130 [Bdellovibrio sp. NC01]